MAPARRARLSSVAATCGRGWLSARRNTSKRQRRADDDGTALSDEILVGIFAGFPEMADLVRSAATCRRWHRLVSSEAAFISRTRRRAPGRFLRPLALGFFSIPHGHGAPRLAPTASATRLLGLGAGGPSLNALVEDDAGLSLDGSRIVASRNGLVVVDLRRGKHDRALKLCVCNPMTGQADVLPPLSGKDGLGHYACTVLTPDDHQADDPPPPARYRLALVYSRRGFTAFRSYTPEDGAAWSPKAKVSDARLGKKQMGVTRCGVVVGGGKAVHWLAKNVAFGLCLDTLRATVLSLPWAWSGFSRAFDVANTLLGVTPEGRLCAVQIEELWLDAATARRPRNVALRVTVLKPARGDWERKELIQVERFLPPEVSRVNLRCFCEKSGVVLFTAGFGDGRSEVYALSLDRQEVEKVASHEPEPEGSGGGGDAVRRSDPWENLHGYEMDRAAYLATLGDGDATEDI